MEASFISAETAMLPVLEYLVANFVGSNCRGEELSSLDHFLSSSCSEAMSLNPTVLSLFQLNLQNQAKTKDIQLNQAEPV